MPLCLKCGTRNSDTALTCQACGSPFLPSQEREKKKVSKRFCGICGATSPGTAQTCQQCGHPF
jgi:ribosomal protein L40E